MFTFGPNKTKLQPSSRAAVEAMMKADSERMALEMYGIILPTEEEIEEEIEDQSRDNSVVRNQGS
jgi:hypothetical protein